VPTGPAVARVEVEQATIRSWTDPFGEVRAQIIVSVTNGGTAAASLPRSGTAYRVMSRDGTVVALGRFAHVFPTVVGPDETAWFIDTLSATLANQSELADVEVALVTGDPGPAESRAVPLSVSDLAWREGSDGGISVTGTVRNYGRETVPRAEVGVILLADDGSPLGVVYDVSSVRDLAPGETSAFTTAYPGTAPIDPAEVAQTVAIAIPRE